MQACFSDNVFKFVDLQVFKCTSKNYGMALKRTILSVLGKICSLSVRLSTYLITQNLFDGLLKIPLLYNVYLHWRNLFSFYMPDKMRLFNLSSKNILIQVLEMNAVGTDYTIVTISSWYIAILLHKVIYFPIIVVRFRYTEYMGNSH